MNEKVRNTKTGFDEFCDQVISDLKTWKESDEIKKDLKDNKKKYPIPFNTDIPSFTGVSNFLVIEFENDTIDNLLEEIINDLESSEEE